MFNWILLCEARACGHLYERKLVWYPSIATRAFLDRADSRSAGCGA